MLRSKSTPNKEIIMGRTLHVVTAPSDVMITDVMYLATPSEPGFAQAAFDTYAEAGAWLNKIGQNARLGGYKIEKSIMKMTAAQVAEMEYEREHDI